LRRALYAARAQATKKATQRALLNLKRMRQRAHSRTVLVETLAELDEEAMTLGEMLAKLATKG
jgi:hypothetical protein